MKVTLSATVHKDGIRLIEREVLKWSQRLRHHAIKSVGAFFNPCGISSHCCEWYVDRSHQNVVEAIGKIDGTEDDAS